MTDTSQSPPAAAALTPDQQAQVNKANVETAIAQAQQAQIAAQQSAANLVTTQLTNLASELPNLGNVKEGSLTIGTGPGLAQSALTFRALEGVSSQIIQHVEAAVQKGEGRENCGSLLVTSNEDLVSSDSTFLDVKSGLDQLVKLAKKLAGDSTPQSAHVDFVAPMLGAAFADLVPPILSMLSPNRTVNTSAIAGDDLSASAAVAGALLRKLRTSASNGNTELPFASVVHDDFRPLSRSGVYKEVADLSALRIKLASKEADADVTSDQKDSIKALMAAIDSFLTSIRSVPSGSTRSLLATAASREQIRPFLREPNSSDSHTHKPESEDGHSPRSVERVFSHVLLVKALGGENQEMINQRPLWFRPTYTSITDMSVAYMLIDCHGDLLGSGTVTCSAVASGDVGTIPQNMTIRDWPQRSGVWLRS